MPLQQMRWPQGSLAKVPAQASLKVLGSWNCHHTLGISESFSWPWEQVVSAGLPGPPIGGVPTLSGILQTGAQNVATQAPWRRHPGHRPAFALVPKKQPSEGECGVRRQGRSPTEGLRDDGVLLESSTDHQGPGRRTHGGWGPGLWLTRTLVQTQASLVPPQGGCVVPSRPEGSGVEGGEWAA